MDKLVRNYITKKSTSRKNLVDLIARTIFKLATLLSASFIVIIVVFIIKKGVAPFVSDAYSQGRVNIITFLTGSEWFIPPNIYSTGFIIINTLFIALLSLLVALPISVLTALFIAKIAPKRIGNLLRTVVELLAAIPSIVYGVFGAGVIVYIVQWIAGLFNYQTAGGLSVLSTVIVLTIMILPTITAISEVAIRSVSKSIEEGSLALGASKTQTNFKVILTSAKSGIFTGAILGIGRALGEATAVSLVAGNRFSGPTFNLFETTKTLTSTMLLGLKETQGLDYDIRFSVGIVLMFVIITTNVLLNFVKRKVGNIDV